MKTLYNLINTGKLIALFSFVLGTCLLVLFLIFPEENNIVTFGLYYVGYAILINAILFLVLIIAAFTFWDYRFKVFKICGLLLINIPIAIGYFFIVINIANF